jgi:hypothetical protein
MDFYTNLEHGCYHHDDHADRNERRDHDPDYSYGFCFHFLGVKAV